MSSNFTDLQVKQFATFIEIDDIDQMYYVCCKDCSKDRKPKRLNKEDAAVFLSTHIGHDTRMIAIIKGKKYD